MVKVLTKRWFEQMDERTNYFDKTSIYLHNYIHGEVIKRIAGQFVRVKFKGAGEYDGEWANGGNISIMFDETIFSDMDTPVIADIPFGDSDGYVKINAGSRRVTFEPKVPVQGVDRDFSIMGYSFEQIGSMSGDKCIFDMVIHVAPDGVEYEDDVSKHNVTIGVIDKDTGNPFLDARRLPDSRISELTRVSASTISHLRSGKRDLDNLAHHTFSMLSQFGELRVLDGMIYDGLENVSDSFQHIFVPSTERLRIVLIDGREYTLKGDANLIADHYDDAVRGFNDSSNSVRFDGLIDGNGVFANAVMIPKANISEIVWDTTSE